MPEHTDRFASQPAGENVQFPLGLAPVAGTLHIFQSGLLMFPGQDYSVDFDPAATTVVTIVNVNAGDNLQFVYQVAP